MDCIPWEQGYGSQGTPPPPLHSRGSPKSGMYPLQRTDSQQRLQEAVFLIARGLGMGKGTLPEERGASPEQGTFSL